MNKNDRRTSCKKAADLSTIIRQILMNNYKPMIGMILMHPKKFYYSDQETPMDLAVIGYSSLSSYSLIWIYSKDMMRNRW